MVESLLLGAIVSTIVEFTKKYVKPLGKLFVIMELIVLSILAGAGYYFLQQSPILLDQLAQIFLYAGSAYAFFWSPIEKMLEEDTVEIDSV